MSATTQFCTVQQRVVRRKFSAPDFGHICASAPFVHLFHFHVAPAVASALVADFALHVPQLITAG
jgi:hypothetical protein